MNFWRVPILYSFYVFFFFEALIRYKISKTQHIPIELEPHVKMESRTTKFGHLKQKIATTPRLGAHQN